MEKIFLSSSFAPEDAELVRQVERLLTSHGLLVLNGRSLGGGGLTPKIEAKIDQADALVALLTRREKQNDKWLPSDWVKDEFRYALNTKKPAIAVLESDVKLEGAYGENQYIKLDRDAPLETFLSLSESIAT